MEFETLKWSPKKHLNYDKIFEKLRNVKKFTFNSSENSFELKLILKSIGKHCLNLKIMEITDLLHSSIVKKLPESLHKLTVGGFRGRCLDIRDLTHLENLRLSSSTLVEVKVQQRLKEFHLKLNLGDEMPDPAKINQLTTLISEKLDVELHLDYASPGYFFAGIARLLSIDYFNKIMNLTLVTVQFYFAIIQEITENLTKIRDTQMFCNCKHYVPLTMNNLMRILDDYRGPASAPASKGIRYIPGTSLTVQFEFDDYEDRYKYFRCFNLGFLFCDCKSVEIEIIFQ